jgi:hypothetical protein
LGLAGAEGGWLLTSVFCKVKPFRIDGRIAGAVQQFTEVSRALWLGEAEVEGQRASPRDMLFFPRKTRPSWPQGIEPATCSLTRMSSNHSTHKSLVSICDLHFSRIIFIRFLNENLGPETNSNAKVFNYKVVDIVENYNFGWSFLHPWSFENFEFQM